MDGRSSSSGSSALALAALWLCRPWRARLGVWMMMMVLVLPCVSPPSAWSHIPHPVRDHASRTRCAITHPVPGGLSLSGHSHCATRAAWRHAPGYHDSEHLSIKLGADLHKDV